MFQHPTRGVGNGALPWEGAFGAVPGAWCAWEGYGFNGWLWLHRHVGRGRPEGVARPATEGSDLNDLTVGIDAAKAFHQMVVTVLDPQTRR